MIWAMSWENLFMPYANNKGAVQPAHPRSLISAFVVRCLDSTVPLVSVSEISSLYLASVAEQAGLSLTWSQTPKTGFLVTRVIYVCGSSCTSSLLFCPNPSEYLWFWNVDEILSIWVQYPILIQLLFLQIRPSLKNCLFAVPLPCIFWLGR